MRVYFLLKREKNFSLNENIKYFSHNFPNTRTGCGKIKKTYEISEIYVCAESAVDVKDLRLEWGGGKVQKFGSCKENDASENRLKVKKRKDVKTKKKKSCGLKE